MQCREAGFFLSPEHDLKLCWTMKKDLSTNKNNVILLPGLAYSYQVTMDHHSRLFSYPLSECKKE